MSEKANQFLTVNKNQLFNTAKMLQSTTRRIFIKIIKKYMYF